MPRNRHRLNWIYDERRQEFKTPAGRTISLAEIAQAVYEQQRRGQAGECAATD